MRLKTAALAGGGAVVALLALAALGYGAFLTWGDGPRGERALTQGRYAEAVRYYDSALSAGYWPSSYRASLLISRASAQMSLRRRDSAVADYTAALALEPTSDLALGLRGVARADDGDYAKALDDLNAAVGLRPGNFVLRLWRARVYDSMLDVNHAIADYAAVIRLAPRIVDAYIREAYNLARQGKVDAAAEVISDVPMTEAYNADAYVERGGVYDTVGASGRALADYEQAIRIDPNSSPAYSNRGLAYSTLGDHVEAMKSFARAIEIAPANGHAWYSRGREEYLSGDYHAARDDFEQAIRLKPDYAYLPLWLHLALMRLGKASPQALGDSAAKTDRTTWPWPVIEFYLGRRNETSLRAAARDDKEPSTVADRVCEAEYYIGALRLAQGSTAAALPAIRRAADICPPGFVELVAARADLKRLGK